VGLGFPGILRRVMPSGICAAKAPISTTRAGQRREIKS
jgi:hypothetical protein